MRLSIQDKYDGDDKVADLRAAVGTDYLSTHLVSVSEDGDTCTVLQDGKLVVQPSFVTWNRFFY